MWSTISRIVASLSYSSSAHRGASGVATAFVEEVKEDFPDLVRKCYVADCPPGKGLEKLEHGAEWF